MHSVQANREALADYLASNRVALHEMSLAEFRGWLADRIAQHENNEVFQQKRRIAALVRRNRRKLRYRETILRKARAGYEESAQAAEIDPLERRIARLHKAIGGLEAAVRAGRADPAKLAAHRSELIERQTDLKALVAVSPEKRRLDRADKALADLRRELGLPGEEETLERLQRSQGRRSGRTGERFEEIAAEAIDRLVVPRIKEGRGDVRHLRRVTLGCARGEFDHLLVRLRPGDEPVEVLAMVEAKRNPNDLIGGFLMRQENLAWLTGDSRGYDPDRYRTHAFPTGHFDRPAIHEERGRRWRFDGSSFARFERSGAAGFFLNRLYLATTTRPLHGATSVALSTILHWVATDADFDLDDETVVRRYRRRVRALVARFQSRDALRLYHDCDLGNQILFCRRYGKVP